MHIRKKRILLACVFILTNIVATYLYASKDKPMKANGHFEIRLDPITDDSNSAGRMLINKVYFGSLEGVGKGQMLSKRTGINSVYSAIEEFNGSLDGKTGTFTLFHTGQMSKTESHLKIIIVEGSGTGELENISGLMSITQNDGEHHYTLEYSL